MPPDTPPALSPTGRPRRATAAGLLALALAAGHARAEAAGGDTEALAKQAQNPIAPGLPAPSLRRDLMVGFGPTVTLPTATAKDLGTGKRSAGPAAVAVWMPGHWVIGALVNNQWSFAGDDDRRQVDQMLVQPFVNYNLGKGWYLASSPIITADWEAKQGKDVWTMPVGGGFGRLFRVGKLPVNTSVQAFDNVEAPEFGTDWTLRLQVQFLFPK